MKYNQLCVLGVFALTAILSTAAHVRADDVQDAVVKDQRLKIEKRITVAAQAAGKHWIGVYAVPVEAALKSHLGIEEDRLIVQQVIGDSPAKKAGVQRFDVLLKFGDTSIATVEDLMKAVDQTEGKETSLDLIRGGKRMSLKVTAEKRPENKLGIVIDQAKVGDVQGLIDGWLQSHVANRQGGGPLRFHVVGPGVVGWRENVNEAQNRLGGATAKLPKNLSIQITKTGDAPAKIKVTRDGETWEVTEENLDELPADVRVHVKRSLGGQAGVAIGFGNAGPNMRLKTLQIHPGIQVKPGATPRVIRPGHAPPFKAPSIRIQRKSADSDVDVEQLRKDVDALKAAVKKLQAAKPRKSKKGDN